MKKIHSPAARLKGTSQRGKSGKRSLIPVALRRPWVWSLGLVAIYFLLALAAYWPVFPGDSSRVVGCACGDAAQSAWFLRWVPYAVTHGLNPLFTSWINVPYGANLSQNTLMPLLGLVTWPLTALAGPIASFNLIAWLAFPLSGTSMFYVMRQLKFSRAAAFAAGLLFGFSPYMAGQGEGHIMLTFVPLLPLILLSFWRLFIQQEKTRSPRKLGVLLAVELIAQFFIDPEILATTALIVLVGTVVLAAARPHYVTRQRVKYALQGLWCAALICVIVLAYPVWFMLSGPQHFKGPNFAPGNPYRSDLIGLVVPMLNQKFTIGFFHHYAISTAAADYSEVGDYVGIVLLGVLAGALVKWWRNRWLAFSVVMGLLFWIGSLGPRLVVNTHKTSVILPFAVLTKIPLFQDMLPSRLSLAEWFFMALAAGLVVTEWWASVAALRRQAGARAKRLLILGVILAAAVAVSLLPRWPYPTKAVDEPRYFKGGASSVAHKTVLAYPLPMPADDQFMLWQAESGMQFKLVAAYIQNPDAGGAATQLPPLLKPYAVEEWLAFERGSTPWSPVDAVSAADINSFIKNYKIDAVVVNPQAVHAKHVAGEFRAVLGAPVRRGDMLVWNDLQQHMR